MRNFVTKYLTRSSCVFLGLCVLISVIAAPQAQASKLDPYYETLKQYNRIDPAQNPQWENATNTMKSTVQDNKNRVVGSVEDIIVSENGGIQSLNVDLNRLQLGKMSLNYREMHIKAASRSYSLALSDKEIKDVVPELLAATETASGEDSDLISIQNLKGSYVKASDGRRIGKVEKIMFDKSGTRATALVMRINYKTTRNKDVAVPFSTAIYSPKGNGYEVLLDDNQADTILTYAAEN